MSTENANYEPIAVIGLACRVPGAADARRFWSNLVAGVDSVRRVPKDQAVLEGATPRELDDENYVPVAGLVDDVYCFDAAFFGISPANARLMDPQLRVGLECAWATFDDAGYAPGRHLSRVGVYVSASFSTYMLQNLGRAQVIETHGGMSTLIASDKDHVATTIAYRLDLVGPALAVGSACSSSLVAIHLACQALRTGDAEMALAGGVSLFFPTARGYIHRPGDIYSRTGRCRAFDRDADGVTPGNGAAMVLLKPLAKALVDRDHIYAVVRGSAVVNDGSLKVGYTAPSEEGQVRTIVAALENAGVRPDDISLVEGHGTATPLGDAVELAALNRVFVGSAVTARAIGSVKSNIGHLDAAAGAISVLKVAKALEARVIPPSLHFEAPNLELCVQGAWYVPTAPQPWPKHATPRRAGASSFGIGGTNAHVVLEEAPPLSGSPNDDEAVLLVLGARSDAALRVLAARLADELELNPELRLVDVAFSIGRRTRFATRRAIVVADRAQAMAWLRALASGHEGQAPVGASPELDAARERWLAGEDVDWLALYGARMPRSVPLPGYPFAREPFRLGVSEPAPSVMLPRLLELELRAGEHELPLRVIDSHEGLPEALDGLCSAAAYWFLSQNAGLDGSNGLLEPRAIAERLGALPQFLPLIELLCELVVQDQLVESPPRGPVELAADLSERFPAARPLVALLLHCVKNYRDVLCRPGAGLVALYDDSETSPLRQMLERAHEQSDTSRSIAGMARALRALARARAGGLRVLEVGAGTGGATRAIVSALQGTASQVTVTDVSRAFVRHLQETIVPDRTVNVSFEELDLLSPTGPAVGRWDVVVVHDALHATGDPARAAANLLTLLAADGAALVSETVRPRRWLSMIWGVSEHWWKSPANSLGPLRPRSEWVKIFRAAGGQVESALSGSPSNPEQSDTGVFVVARQREATHAPIDSGEPGLYGRRWVEAALPPSITSRDATWIVLADQGGLAARLLKRLGGAAYEVRAGAGFSRKGARSFTVRPDHHEDWAKVFEACGKPNDGEALWRIVHLWSLDVVSTPSQPIGVKRANGFDSMLAIARALASSGVRHPVEIGVVTAGAFDVLGTEELEPSNSMLAAPVQILPREQPSVRAWMLDVELSSAEASFERGIRATLDLFGRATLPASLLALRGTRLWRESFQQLSVPKSRSRADVLRRGGRYLILGGLGAIGLELAQELSRGGDAHIVLCGRSAPEADMREAAELEQLQRDETLSPRVVTALRRLLAEGATISFRPLDLGVAGAVRSVFEEIEANFGPINGVVHCAGLPDFGGVMGRRERSVTDAALAAKVVGGLELDAAIANRDLDFIVYSASMGSLFPNLKFGEVAYVAANDFLAALAARQERQRPGRVTAINWTDWNEAGMWVDSQVRLRAEYVARPENGGAAELMPDILHAITPAEGRNAFVSALNEAEPLVVVCGQSLDSLLARHREFSPADHAAFLERLGLTRSARVQTNSDAPQPLLLDLVEQRLAAIWCELLGLASVSREDDFFELGGDSLLALRVLNRLKTDFGITETLNELLELTTVAKLGERVRTLQSRAGSAASHQEFEDLEL
jgi:3-oxoacyl-(acyl-carrier-protein) synthase/NAD(P)-dependent dehydrogenase (short-subunit alcohol dehydrogenase family)/SAM-dependent methyltransferase/acyl carrier protein